MSISPGRGQFLGNIFRHAIMKMKKIFYVFVFSLLGIFIAQNIALVSVVFLFWEFTLPRSVMLASAFIIGMSAGFWYFDSRSRKNKNGRGKHDISV